MSSYRDPRRCSSIKQPTTMGSSLERVKKEFIELHNTDSPELQQCLSKLSNIIKTYSDNCLSVDKGSKHGKGSVIAGSVIMGVGALLAPVTLGASAALVGAGATVAAGGGIGKKVWSSKKRNLETNYIKDLKVELNTFQNKLIPVINKMKELHQCVQEILKDLKNPKNSVGFLAKHFDSAPELADFIQIYDAGGLAKQLSETVRLTGTITGTLINTSTDEEIKELYDKCVKVMNTIETTEISLGH